MSEFKGLNNSVTINTILRWAMGLSLAVAVCAVLWFFREVVVYILISAVLAVIGRPLVGLLCRIKIKQFAVPRWLAAIITLLFLWVIIGGLLVLIAPLISQKIAELSSLDLNLVMKSIEAPLASIQSFLSSVLALPESELSLSDQMIAYAHQFIPTNQSDTIASSIVGISISMVIALFSITFITFFFLKEDGLFSTMVSAIFPEKYSENVHRAIDKISVLLSRYFTGIVTESLIIAGVITVVLFLFGMHIKDACFIAVVMGLFNVVPYAGPALGGMLSVFAGVVSPIEGCSIDYTIKVIVGTLCVVKLIDDFVLQPFIYSSKVKAHPLEIFIVILMAGSVGGFIGLLVAVPSYTVIRVFAKEFFSEVALVRKLTKKI